MQHSTTILQLTIKISFDISFNSGNRKKFPGNIIVLPGHNKLIYRLK